MQNFEFVGTIRLRDMEQDIGAMDFGFSEGAREIYTNIYHLNPGIIESKIIDLKTTAIGRANFFAIRCDKPIKLGVNHTLIGTESFQVRDFVIMQCDQITKLSFRGVTAYRHPNKVRIWIGAQGISGD